MNNLQIFSNPEFGSIRTIEQNGEPWFIGKDVAQALGYAKPENALAAHVDEQDKTTTLIQGDGSNYKSKTTIINESGLYSLVLSSKLPTAKKFRRWVTSEVLPSIRKHGAYMTPQTLQAAILNPDTMIQLCQQLKAEQDANQRLREDNAVLAPKGIFADAVSASNKSILVGELAKLLCQNGVPMGQNRLFGWLRENGYLIRDPKRSDYNMPTQRAVEQKLFEIKESTVVHSDGHTTLNKTPKVTGKGQIYFVNLFLKLTPAGEMVKP